MNIEVDSSSIKSVGTKIIDDAEQLNQSIKRINNILDKIESSWSGQDATKYLYVMRNINLIELQKLKEIINDYGEYLIKVPEVYQALDEVFSKKTIE